MERARNTLSFLILAVAFSIVFLGASRASTVVNVSATGAPSQQFSVTSGIPVRPFSIGNWSIGSLLVDVFSTNKGTGQSVQGSVAIQNVDLPILENLEILVSTNNLFVGGTDLPSGTLVQLASNGLVSSDFTINSSFVGTYVSNSNAHFDLQQPAAVFGTATNGRPGSLYSPSGQASNVVNLFEEQPFSITTLSLFRAFVPGEASFDTTAAVVPLPATLPLLLGSVFVLGAVVRRRRRYS